MTTVIAADRQQSSHDKANISEVDVPQWQEIPEAELPNFPRNGDLIEVAFRQGPNRYEYHMDEKSISVGIDLVFRYTIIVKSPTGATNVFYEGIRCDTREYKTYAFGINTGTWQFVPESAWQRAIDDGVTFYRAALIDDYVCEQSSRPLGIEKIYTRLTQSYTNMRDRIFRRTSEDHSIR